MLELLGKAQRPVLPESFIAPSSGVLPCPHDDDTGQIGELYGHVDQAPHSARGVARRR